MTFGSCRSLRMQGICQQCVDQNVLGTFWLKWNMCLLGTDWTKNPPTHTKDVPFRALFSTMPPKVVKPPEGIPDALKTDVDSESLVMLRLFYLTSLAKWGLGRRFPHIDLESFMEHPRDPANSSSSPMHTDALQYGRPVPIYDGHIHWVTVSSRWINVDWGR